MKPFSPAALTTCIVCDWLWSIAMLAGCAYVVFGLGHSGFWFVAAVFLASCWTCKRYRSPEQLAADPGDDA